ncbi:MAG TPA: hypothetical protein VLB27_03560, partial [candidate division Zixibacteria bacterium]|nr:hypothetical protein [candidate division Zixibacteria bacterium]
MQDIFKKVFGDHHSRTIKKIQPLVEQINEVFPSLAELSDDQLRGKTDELRARVRELTDTFGPDGPAEGERPEERDRRLRDERALLQERLDEILPTAYAVVKEGARRLCGTSWPVVEQEVGWEMV